MVVGLKGLTSNAKQSSIDELNSCLADAISLSRAIKQAHWNCKGINFIAVHELFDAVNDRLEDQIDTMAERIQVLDGVAIGTVEDVAKNTSLKPYPTDLTKTQDHIRAICERMREYGEKVRKAVDSTDEAGDVGTSDLLTGASREADKDLWFLESHLE